MPAANNPWGDIRVSREGHLAHIELARPPHNYFDFNLIRQLAEALEMLDAAGDCRAIVLSAQGKSFCAGADFGSGKTDTAATQHSSQNVRGNTTGILYQEAVRLFRCRKPLIAAVQGPAIGGGLGLALAADFRVAGPNARFAANFAKLGLHQGFGLSITLPALVGQQQAALMLLTGRRIKPDQALAMGLIDELVTTDPVPAAKALAAEIAENAPLALLSIRATLRAGLADEIAMITRHELAEQQRLRTSADYQEGLRAVAQRRPGNFQGC